MTARGEVQAAILRTVQGNDCTVAACTCWKGTAMRDLAQSGTCSILQRCARANRLTHHPSLADTGHPVLENTLIRGKPSRKSKALFSSTGFTPMGGMGQKYKTRKGNTASRRITVFNILPTSLENEVKSQYGVSMTTSTRTPEQSPASTKQRRTSRAQQGTIAAPDRRRYSMSAIIKYLILHMVMAGSMVLTTMIAMALVIVLALEPIAAAIGGAS
jgi:hypothetical protein